MIKAASYVSRDISESFCWLWTCAECCLCLYLAIAAGESKLAGYDGHNSFGVFNILACWAQVLSKYLGADTHRASVVYVAL